MIQVGAYFDCGLSDFFAMIHDSFIGHGAVLKQADTLARFRDVDCLRFFKDSLIIFPGVCVHVNAPVADLEIHGLVIKIGKASP